MIKVPRTVSHELHFINGDHMNISALTSASLAAALIAAASVLAFIPLLSLVPATFYGFASTFAFLGHSAEAFTVKALTALSFQNAIFSVPASLLIGTALGIAQGWLASAFAGSAGGAKPGLSSGHFAKGFKP